MGKGFVVFVFKREEGNELIFRNIPYFMGPQGMFFNKWTPNFDPSENVPYVVLV